MKLATSPVMNMLVKDRISLMKLILRILALAALMILADVSATQGTDLPDSAYITGVHGHPQKHSLSCESRSAADLAAFWGISLGENEFLGVLPRADNPELGFVGSPDDPWGYIPPHSYGVHAGPVADTLDEFGLQATALNHLSWDDLRGEINAGHPVIVWIIGQMWAGSPVEYQAPDGATSIVATYEHTMILTGYNMDTVQVLDAYSGQYQTYPLSTFLQSWSVLGNMAVFSSGDAPVNATPTTEGDRGNYTVQPGDYLIELANKFGTTWQVLAELNAIVYPYSIYPGQVLQLPPTPIVSDQPEATVVPPEQAPVEPVVRAKDFQVHLPLVAANQPINLVQEQTSLSSSASPAEFTGSTNIIYLSELNTSPTVDWSLFAQLRDLAMPVSITPGDPMLIK
jgi:uncharacterized protein YvpB